MNKLLSKALVASMFFVLATGTTAFAQFPGSTESAPAFEHGLDVNIPFAFYAGNTLLPAGEYAIRRAGTEAPDPSELLLIRNANHTVEVLLITAVTTRNAAISEASVDFDRVGNKEFLSTIWEGGRLTGFQLEKARLERRLEKVGKKEKHSVTARQGKP